MDVILRLTGLEATSSGGRTRSAMHVLVQSERLLWHCATVGALSLSRLHCTLGAVLRVKNAPSRSLEAFGAFRIRLRAPTSCSRLQLRVLQHVKLLPPVLALYRIAGQRIVQTVLQW